jgi:hypothetical protein
MTPFGWPPQASMLPDQASKTALASHDASVPCWLSTAIAVFESSRGVKRRAATTDYSVMPPNRRPTSWEERIRPWQLAAGILAITELPVMVAAFALLLGGGSSTNTWAYASLAGFVGLEVAKWLVEAAGLRQIPDVDIEGIYVSAPLDRRHRQLVGFNLLLLPVVAVFLLRIAATTFDVSPAIAALFLLILGQSAVRPLSRVWRCNSWLAISRLPSRPRRPTVDRGGV